MYIVNPETVPKNKLYTCNSLIANFLIYKQHLPLLSRVGKVWYFAKTDALAGALKELPLWFKIIEKGGSHID